MKIYAFSANDVLQNANGLDAAASAKDKQLGLAIDKFTKDFLKDSNIGLIDCKDGASELNTILTRHAGEGGLGDAPRDEAKPAAGGALPF